MTYLARVARHWRSTLSVALMSTAAWAAPVVYDEAIGGDLPAGVAGDGIALPTFDFDLGVNTITGVVTAGITAGDRDSFAFNVAAGHQVSAANVTLADLTGNVGQSSWILYRGSNQAFAGDNLETIFAPSPGVTPFTFSLPLTENVYNVSNIGVSLVPGDTATYTFAFTVVPVPEPASASLLALGSAVVLRRRRH